LVCGDLLYEVSFGVEQEVELALLVSEVAVWIIFVAEIDRPQPVAGIAGELRDGEIRFVERSAVSVVLEVVFREQRAAGVIVVGGCAGRGVGAGRFRSDPGLADAPAGAIVGELLGVVDARQSVLGIEDELVVKTESITLIEPYPTADTLLSTDPSKMS
jgi:hypothetical protein